MGRTCAYTCAKCLLENDDDNIYTLSSNETKMHRLPLKYYDLTVDTLSVYNMQLVPGRVNFLAVDSFSEKATKFNKKQAHLFLIKNEYIMKIVTRFAPFNGTDTATTLTYCINRVDSWKLPLE